MRAKDLHDLARILSARPIGELDFWERAAHEFKLACESRLVDCEGSATFRENPEATELTYSRDESLAAISWEEAEASLTRILQRFEELQVFPLTFPLER